MADVEQPLPDVQAGLIQRTFAEWRTLAVLGGPILIAQLAQMANGVIDTIMSGHVSAEDLAAVGIGASLWMPLLLFFVGVLSALQPIISRHLGAQSEDRVVSITWQGLYIALASSVVMMLLLSNVGPVFHILQMDGTTAGISQRYLNAVAWGVPAMLVMAALRGLTDGLGHTRVFMAFSLLAALINLPLNYIFIYGKLGVPAMGGAGCGWATALSTWLSLIALACYLHWSRPFQPFHLTRDWVKPHIPVIKQLLHLGLPIGFTMFVEVSLFAVIALFLAPLGPVVVAGHQIVLNVTSLIFMLPLSLGMALTLRVSFLVGAEAHASARLLARSALLLAGIIALVYAPVLLVAREEIAALYTHDPAVQKTVIQLLLYAAIFQIADVVQVAAIGSLRGYHDTRVPMLIMLLSFWGICLPLGYTLTFTDLVGEAKGAAGFWMALIVGLTCASVLLTARLLTYRRPRPLKTTTTFS